MIRQRASLRASADRGGSAGRVGGTLFFLFWCAIPTVMLVLMVRQAASELAPRSWTPADCTVVESGVGDVSDDRYAFNVRYAYTAGPLSAVEAPARIGTVYARGYKGDADYSKAQRLAIRYAPGARATCYVNPYDPNVAVLARPIPTTVYMLPLPLLFIAIGVAGLWFTWRGGGRDAKPEGATPISSSQRPQGRGARVGAAFSVVAVLIGVALAIYMGGRVANVLAARSWTAVQATVVKSEVRTQRGDESTTYSPNILYKYTFDGREYGSNRYAFMGGSSSGYDAKRQLVSRYAPGMRFTAYVDPSDPVEAVIERGFTTDMLVLLVPVAFILVGVAGLYFSVRSARRAGATAGCAMVRSDRLAAPLAGRFVPTARSAPQAGRLTGAPGCFALKPAQSPGLKLFSIAVVAAFWNGIVSVFVYTAYFGSSAGHANVCLGLFMIPFVGSGLALAGAVVYYSIALFNPRCELTVDRDTLALGDSAELRWTFTGRIDAIYRLTVRVEGREEAVYRRGTDTYTDKNVFFVRELTDTTRPAEIRAGSVKWAVPPDTMHSFTSGNNKVAWTLHVRGHIRGRPDVKEEYVLTVAPLPAQKVATAPDDSTSREPIAPQAGRLTGGEQIEIQLDGRRDLYVPGETIAGIASWQLDAPADAMEVRLFWYTRGKGTQDVHVVKAQQLDAAGVRGRRAFRFVLPEEPYSFSGKLVSLIWALEAVAQPGERVGRQELVVGPGGREVVLDAEIQ
jgi:hypothetical protein